jgi:hypothetical protein
MRARTQLAAAFKGADTVMLLLAQALGGLRQAIEAVLNTALT